MKNIIAMIGQIKMKNCFQMKRGEMMQKEKYRAEDYYIIKRRHKETKKQEYLAGMTLYGRDKENILRVKNTTWVEQPILKRNFCVSVTSNFESAKARLEGIQKYCNDDNYEYSISKIMTEYIVSELVVLQ